MNRLTAGHLINNGGIRGHSAGDYYPWRVMAQGKLDNLKYWVINPQGRKLHWFNTAHDACDAARLMHSILSQ